MKKLLLPIIILSLAATSCNTTDGIDQCGRVEVQAAASEVFTLESWLTSNGISAVKDERGFFYVVHRGGSDIRPSPCSGVTASYTLRTLNGTQIEASSGTTFQLNNTIVGWQEGIPLIGEGGSITLYLPPSLAYGANGSASGRIPPNSNLMFQVELIDVK